MEQVIKKLDNLERLIKSQSLNQKEVLTFQEGCDYCGFMPSHMYKLTSLDIIPHYKPNGKMFFFRRCDLQAWLLRNPSFTKEEIQQEAGASLNQTGRAQS